MERNNAMKKFKTFKLWSSKAGFLCGCGKGKGKRIRFTRIEGQALTFRPVPSDNFCFLLRDVETSLFLGVNLKGQLCLVEDLIKKDSLFLFNNRDGQTSVQLKKTGLFISPTPSKNGFCVFTKEENLLEVVKTKPIAYTLKWAASSTVLCVKKSGTVTTRSGLKDIQKESFFVKPKAKDVVVIMFRKKYIAPSIDGVSIVLSENSFLWKLEKGEEKGDYKICVEEKVIHCNGETSELSLVDEKDATDAYWRIVNLVGVPFESVVSKKLVIPSDNWVKLLTKLAKVCLFILFFSFGLFFVTLSFEREIIPLETPSFRRCGLSLKRR